MISGPGVLSRTIMGEITDTTNAVKGQSYSYLTESLPLERKTGVLTGSLCHILASGDDRYHARVRHLLRHLCSQGRLIEQTSHRRHVCQPRTDHPVREMDALHRVPIPATFLRNRLLQLDRCDTRSKARARGEYCLPWIPDVTDQADPDDCWQGGRYQPPRRRRNGHPPTAARWLAYARQGD